MKRQKTNLRAIIRYALMLLFAGVFSAACSQSQRVEYFFDHDPGPGNAIPVPLGDELPAFTLGTQIPTSGLEPGYHKLYFRTRHGGWSWSLYEPYLFFIESDIILAEYFFDHDPGPGNGIPVSVTAPGNPAALVSELIPTQGLEQGGHTLFIRTKNSAGHWSLAEPKSFHIRVDVVRAEYFFDTDPGVGNGRPLSVNDPDNVTDINAAIDIGPLAEGSHTLNIRTRNQLGVWSLTEPQAFTVEGPLPVELLSFEVKTTPDQKVNLKWATATEKNNDHFTIQHSSVSTEFSDVASLPGAGTTLVQTKYAYTHKDPDDGLNYYRLMQTDYDGTSTYSAVKAATVVLEKKPYVYPIPSGGEWFVDLSRMESARRYFIEVTDITGRKQYEQSFAGGQIVRFAGHEFASGTYFLFVRSDRDILLTQKVILY